MFKDICGIWKKYCDQQFLFFHHNVYRIDDNGDHLINSFPTVDIKESYMDSIDKGQTARNVQSDLLSALSTFSY